MSGVKAMLGEHEPPKKKKGEEADEGRRTIMKTRNHEPRDSCT